jgi:hypothetical protein
MQAGHSNYQILVLLKEGQSRLISYQWVDFGRQKRGTIEDPKSTHFFMKNTK